MLEVCSSERCTSCLACKSVCPQKAISTQFDSMGKEIPVIDQTNCVDCKLCQNVCPECNAVELQHPVKCVALRKKEYDKSASSSGVCSALSEIFLNNNGSAFGAVFDNCGNAKIVNLLNRQDIEKAKGSKYVHCSSDGVFEQVKSELESDKRTLFIGTPCQVAGLKNYLRKEYSNLYTVDLICHGAPPNKYLQEHLSGILQPSVLTAIQDIKFRGEYDFYFRVFCDDKEVYNKKQFEDYYFSTFLKGFTYQNNCYSCRYATENRIGDITCGDFWGIGEDCRLDGKISCVLVNSEKGLELLADCADLFEFEERELQEAVNGNAQLRKPAEILPQRKEFEVEYIKHGFEPAIKKVWRRQMILDKICAFPGIRTLRQLRHNVRKKFNT